MFSFLTGKRKCILCVLLGVFGLYFQRHWIFGINQIFISHNKQLSTNNNWKEILDDFDQEKKEIFVYAEPTNCQPQKRILLLKTHKTGSSTVTNILNRFADENNLHVALPIRSLSRFEWPSIFTRASVDKESLDDGFADVLTNHARLDREEMEMIMKDDTFFISILRNPITQYQSTFYYLRLFKIFRLSFSNNPLQEFMGFPRMFLKQVKGYKSVEGLLQNGMLFDLGYDKKTLKSVSIEEAINQLEKDIDLFLILEYFDESLILLKRHMCWTFDNIMYFKQNQRKLYVPIDSTTRNKIKIWNKGDMKLYHHFNKTFWKKVNKEGPSFWEEVQEFRKFKNVWEERCKSRTITKGKQAAAVKFFRVSKNIDKDFEKKCRRFFRTELEYLKYFRDKIQAKKDKALGYKLVHI